MIRKDRARDVLEIFAEAQGLATDPWGLGQRAEDRSVSSLRIHTAASNKLFRDHKAEYAARKAAGKVRPASYWHAYRLARRERNRADLIKTQVAKEAA